MATKKKTDSGQVGTLVWRTEEWPLKRLLGTRRAGFNPKQAEPGEIARIAESYRVLGVGRSFSVRDDELLLDGHQSVLAFERLLSGQHKVKGKLIAWTPVETVTVRVVSGMSDSVARAYIAAVTHNRVETDHEMFARLIADLNSRVQGRTGEDDVGLLLASVDAIGLSPTEFTDYVDLANMSDPAGGKTSGGGAPPSPGVPKLTLEFTDPDLRDRVKCSLAENAKSDKEPHGNVLARIVSEWSKAAKVAKPAKKLRQG